MIDRLRYRISQGRRHLRSSAPESNALHDLLTAEARARFATLSNADQQHCLAVARNLEVLGAPPELVAAGLLHDIGKSVPGVPVRLPHRMIKVLLARVSIRLLHRIAAGNQPRSPFDGVWVLAHHARYGAELVRCWGYPERVAWLVEHHEDRPITDRQLALLVAIDDRLPSIPALTGLAHG